MVLFALAIYMLIKSAESQGRGPLSKSGIRQPPIRAFMDDLTVTRPNVLGSRCILKGLKEVFTWAHMTFKPQKPRCHVLKKGKATNKLQFILSSTRINHARDSKVSWNKLWRVEPHCI